LTAIRDGLDRIYEFGKAVTSNGSAQPKTVQKLAAPGIDGNGHSIVEAFINRVKTLMLELKMQLRASFFKKENCPLMVITVSDPAIPTFGNIVMARGSLNTVILPAVCNDPSSNITSVEKRPAFAHANVQIPDLDEDARQSNTELEPAIEHLHEP